MSVSCSRGDETGLPFEALLWAPRLSGRMHSLSLSLSRRVKSRSEMSSKGDTSPSFNALL
jgi:hypothetical protein